LEPTCCAILTARFLFTPERIMQKLVLRRALQQEIRRHDLNYFIHEPPSIAQGGTGVFVPGCPEHAYLALLQPQQKDAIVSISTVR